MLKIRLMRIGAKGRPFYRIVVVDERKKRTGSYLELLGTYNPLTTPKEIKIDQTKVDEWVKKGAQLSDGFLRITKQNTHIEPRKVRNPGKLRSNTPAKEEPVVSEQSSVDSNEVEETTADVAAASEAETAATDEVVTPTEETTATTEELTTETTNDTPFVEEAPEVEESAETPADEEEKAS